MIRSTYSANVFYFPPGSLVEGQTLTGGWYYSDESNDLVLEEVFLTEKEAIKAVELYADGLG